MTTNKNISKIHKRLAPADTEHTVCYIPKPINYAAVDGIGHEVKHGNNKPARTGTQSRTNPPT